MQPLDQSLQRADREATLGLDPHIGSGVAELVGDRAWQAALPFRFGYAMQAAGVSPRRNVADVQV